MYAYCLNNPIANTDVSGNICSASFSFWKSCADVSGETTPASVDSTELEISNNTIADALKANRFSIYRGVPVVKLPIGKNAFSFGIIFLGNEVSDMETLQHEYGHSVNFALIGMPKYIVKVFVPSLVGFWSGVDYAKYYSLPWEYVADVLGNVNRSGYEYSQATQKLWILYLLYSGC